MSARADARFTQLDANHDGQITPDEAAKAPARMHKTMGGGGPGMGSGPGMGRGSGMGSGPGMGRGGTPPSQP